MSPSSSRERRLLPLYARRTYVRSLSVWYARLLACNSVAVARGRQAGESASANILHQAAYLGFLCAALSLRGTREPQREAAPRGIVGRPTAADGRSSRLRADAASHGGRGAIRKKRDQVK